MNPTLKLIHNRRSIRSFKQKRIDQETRNKILDAAIRSPTAGNMMLYSIIEIDDVELKNKLVTTCDNQPFIARAPLVLLFLADYQRWFDFFLSSGVESYCHNHNQGVRLPGEGDLMLACCDALIAAQTAVIAAESLGVGSCYIGDIMENFELHRELFKLPQYSFPVTMLCLGYPTESAATRPRTSRIDRDHIIHTNRYSQTPEPILQHIFSDKQPKQFSGDTTNTGQHYYIRKFAADYSVEMTRSVQQAVKSWCSEIPE